MMGVAKPCLGYASRTEAIVALKAIGHSNSVIAEKTGVSVNIVSSLLISASRTRKHRGPQDVDKAARVKAVIYDLFPLHQRELARAHAAKRGVTTTRLIQMVVERVFGDDIVDAVLDDADEMEKRS